MNLGVFGVIHDLDGIGLGHLIIVWANRLDLNHLHIFCRVAIVTENNGAIGGHALLRYNDTLTTANNEVAAIILRAFTERDRVQVFLVM